jgi:hypothetical protein
MSVRYIVHPPIEGDMQAGLIKRFGRQRAIDILESHLVEIAALRRAMWAEGRAADPNFILSSKAYDAAAAGDWLVLVDVDGTTTVKREGGR